MIIYKDISNLPGIYSIRNRINNKIYIGSSINCKQRAYDHLSSLRKNKHANQYLQNAWNLYKEDNFEFIVVASVLDKNHLCKIEQEFIDEYQVYLRDKGYNLSPTAGNTLGIKQSPETIRKKQEIFKGEKNPFYGKHHSDETKKILSRKGKERSKVCTNPFFNKKHTDETKFKMRNAKRIEPFMCNETGEVFTSTGDASEKLNIHIREISNAVYGRQKTTHGYSFKFI